MRSAVVAVFAAGAMAAYLPGAPPMYKSIEDVGTTPCPSDVAEVPAKPTPMPTTSYSESTMPVAYPMTAPWVYMSSPVHSSVPENTPVPEFSPPAAHPVASPVYSPSVGFSAPASPAGPSGHGESTPPPVKPKPVVPGYNAAPSPSPSPAPYPIPGTGAPPVYTPTGAASTGFALTTGYAPLQTGGADRLSAVAGLGAVAAVAAMLI